MRSRFSNFEEVTRNSPPRRLTVEKLALDCLDIRELKRAGVFNHQRTVVAFPFRWLAIRSLSVARYGIRLELQKQITPQHIRVSWTACRYGGMRPWLHWPYCHRRVAKLYKAIAGYCCRICIGNPPYASQTKSAAGRRHFALCKLRILLGGDAKPGSELPDRPRGMRRKKYRILRARIEGLEWVLARRLREKPPDYANLACYLPS